jgi:hypothetical protein
MGFETCTSQIEVKSITVASISLVIWNYWDNLSCVCRSPYFCFLWFNFVSYEYYRHTVYSMPFKRSYEKLGYTCKTSASKSLRAKVSRTEAWHNDTICEWLTNSAHSAEYFSWACNREKTQSNEWLHLLATQRLARNCYMVTKVISFSSKLII